MTAATPAQPPDAEPAAAARSVVGRDAELARVAAFLDRRGDPTVALVLEGDPGIGKSTLWQEGVRRARAAGWQVLVARPAEVEAGHAYVGLGDLLRSVPAAIVERLPDVQRHALDVALLRAPGDVVPLDLRTVAVGLLSVLAELALAGPVLIAIDDSQWLDASTADVLRFAGRRLPASGIAILTARRRRRVGAPDRAAGAGFEDAVEVERRERVAVGGLSLAALHRLLAERLGRSFSRPTLVRIDALAHGNPFYALEIGRELVASPEPSPGAPLPLPSDLRELLEARVQRLPQPTRLALLLAGAAGTARLAELAPAWADLGGREGLETALAPAQTAAVATVSPAGVIQFGHPLLAAALYGGAREADRAGVHRALAAHAADQEERARHLALAATDPDAEVAEALEAAADMARRRGATAAAVELGDLAVLRTPAADESARDRRRVTLARSLLAAGDHERARLVAEELVAGSQRPDLRAQAYQVLAGVAEITLGVEAAMRYADLAVADAVGDPRLRAAIHAHASRTFDNDIPRKVELARAAMADASTLAPDDLVVADSLMAMAEAELMAGDGFDAAALDRAEAIEQAAGREPREAREAAYLRAWLEVHTEQLAAAERDFSAFADFTEAAGLELRNGRCHVGLAALAIRRGDLDVAERHVHAVEGVDRRTGSSLDWDLIAGATIAAHRGDLLLARDLASRAADRSRARLAQHGEAIVVLGLASLIAGDLAAAATHYEAAAAIDAGMGNGEPGCAHFEADRIEALIGAGRTTAALVALEAFEAHGRRHDRPWILGTARRCRALLRVAEGQLDAAAADLAAALQQHGRLPMRIVEARTLLVLGMVERRRRRYRAARAAFHRARELAVQAGAGAWIAKADAELARTHVREAPADLTPTERQIAELAAAGRTNREIAQRLFVSPKTVEANLARAYRKLSIGSRAELGAAIGRAPGPGGGPPTEPEAGSPGQT